MSGYTQLEVPVPLSSSSSGTPQGSSPAHRSLFPSSLGSHCHLGCICQGSLCILIIYFPHGAWPSLLHRARTDGCSLSLQQQIVSIYLSFPKCLCGSHDFPEPPTWVEQRPLTFAVREGLCPLPLVQTILHRIPDYLEARITEQTDFGARLSISWSSSQVWYGAF